MTRPLANRAGCGSIWIGAIRRPPSSPTQASSSCRPGHMGFMRHDTRVLVLLRYGSRCRGRRVATVVPSDPGGRDIGHGGARSRGRRQRPVHRSVSDQSRVLGGQWSWWRVDEVPWPCLLGGGDVGVLETTLPRCPAAAGLRGSGSDPQWRSKGSIETRDGSLLAEGQEKLGEYNEPGATGACKML